MGRISDVSYEKCNKQGKLFAMANRLGYDMEKYAARCMTSELLQCVSDSDYIYYQLAAPSYSLDLIEDEELHIDLAGERPYSNDEAYWIGFYYRFLTLALSLPGKDVLAAVPFETMHGWYGELGHLSKEESEGEFFKRAAKKFPSVK